MRIAWLTPWAPESAIAEFSALVVAELPRIADVEVDIWYPSGAGGRLDPVPGRELDLRAAEALRSYDTVVYNVGNHLGFHGSIYELSLTVPGTVILHDVTLTGMFVPLLLKLRDEQVRHVLEGWYGVAGGREAGALREDPESWVWKDGHAERFPMLEPALEGAVQVIAHSHHAANVVRERFVGDVHTIGLPALHWPQEGAQAATFDWLDERPVVLQAGALNPNKCVPVILEAFRDHALGEHFQLVIAGHMRTEHRLQLEQTVSAWGLTGSVRVLGTVDDETLQALRHVASIATVLRSPVTESASAVLIDSLAHGLATIATDVGHYREHPADVVERLPAPPRAEDLGRLLARWAREPEEVARRGRAAAAYAAARHTARHYAEALLTSLSVPGGTRRRESLARAAAALVVRNGFRLDSELASRVAEQAAFLFAGEPRLGRR